MNQAVISIEESYTPPLDVNLAGIEAFVLQVLSEIGVDGWEVSVLFCGDEMIASLNEEYRHIAGATDVLSFEQGGEYLDEEGRLWYTAGDIVISVDTLVKNADAFQVGVDEELRRLLIHGILHLHGEDHSDNDPRQPMLVLQERVLAAIPCDCLVGGCGRGRDAIE